MGGVRTPAGCLPPQGHEKTCMEENKQLTSISPLCVHFLALDWNVSQDKIWVRSIWPVSNISHFYKMYGCFLLGQSNCCQIIKLCLHFSLIFTASFGAPAPTLLSWDKLLPFDSFHCLHPLPSPSMYLCCFLCYQLPAFCLTGYLCNSLVCVS